MNRRGFLKAAGFLAGAAMVPKPVWKSILADWDTEQLLGSNAALGIYDAENNLLAIGATQFERARYGKSATKNFYATAFKTGRAEYASLTNEDGEICRLTVAEADVYKEVNADLVFNSVSIFSGDHINIPILEKGVAT